MDKTSEDSFEWADVYEDDDIDHDDGMDDFEEMGRMSKQNNAAVSDGQVNIAVTDGESVTTTTSDPTTISTTTTCLHRRRTGSPSWATRRPLSKRPTKRETECRSLLAAAP